MAAWRELGDRAAALGVANALGRFARGEDGQPRVRQRLDAPDRVAAVEQLRQLEHQPLRFDGGELELHTVVIGRRGALRQCAAHAVPRGRVRLEGGGAWHAGRRATALATKAADAHEGAAAAAAAAPAAPAASAAAPAALLLPRTAATQRHARATRHPASLQFLVSRRPRRHREHRKEPPSALVSSSALALLLVLLLLLLLLPALLLLRPLLRLRLRRRRVILPPLLSS